MQMKRIINLTLGLAFVFTVASCSKEEPIQTSETGKVESSTFYPSQNVEITELRSDSFRVSSSSSSPIIQVEGEDGRRIHISPSEKNNLYKVHLLRGDDAKHTLYMTYDGGNVQVHTLNGKHLISGYFSSDFRKLIFTKISFGESIEGDNLRSWKDASTASKICGIGMGLIGGGIAILGAAPTAGAAALAYAAIYSGLSAMICDGW